MHFETSQVIVKLKYDVYYKIERKITLCITERQSDEHAYVLAWVHVHTHNMGGVLIIVENETNEILGDYLPFTSC